MHLALEEGGGGVVLCCVPTKKGGGARSLSIVQSAPQNGDGPAEADFAVMRVCA